LKINHYTTNKGIEKEEKMLKIKDSVDLKELEKFGFKPEYNKDTGMIEQMMACRECYILCWFKVKQEDKKKLVVSKYRKIEWARQNYNFDLLYDLIKADLVEKI